MRILIIDDEQDMALILEKRLKIKGHDVEVSFDGASGLENIEKKTYDLIILDHNMPGLTGLELSKVAKEKNNNVKVIMITGYPIMKDFFAKAVGGVDEYLEKPVKLKDVEKLVEKYTAC